MDFTAELLKWYRAHRRDLLWKQTNDPYKIWLSEIILQQTRVEQGEPYYRRFTERFPTVQDLAAAPLDEVLLLWQGLGYYSRARHLHGTAQQIVAEHGGRFPRTREALLKLKGIGPYTAAAIASFAFKEAVPAIDGNGYRILSRVFGMDEPVDTGAGKKLFAGIAEELIPSAYPGDFNQALMDFGSLVCTPARPLCPGCPLLPGCYAFAHKSVEKFPVKSKRTAVRTRYFYYLFIQYENSVFIRKRTKKDIWQGLYEFPLIETAARVPPEKLMAGEQWAALFGTSPLKIRHISEEIKHQLTHQTLYATFYTIGLHEISPALQSGYLNISPDLLDSYSLPRLVTLFLGKYLNIQKLFLP
ncbi:MAG: A/G-specific adenine glycosylase [Prevotellaceae bacterium]|jgi:A/G-specific adenine glycosylase|nr:A/G-specific adenine glycosylase [Prevotellaceae bacterium]